MIVSFAFLVWRNSDWWFGGKRSGSWKGIGEKSNWQTPAQWFNFLLTSHFLSGMHSSETQAENVAQIRVSARWGGWETGKQREGIERERERRETNSSQFTQAKGLLAHLYRLLGPLRSLDSSGYKQGQSANTHTHINTSREDRQRQEIPLNSYKVRLQHGCAPGPFEKVCQCGCKVSMNRGAAEVMTFLW